ncbi:response regulator [Arenibacter latericius]|uniref:response regulator n=1 Tax=Arenibacter latericius TaxID=86104 RepID=UPI00047A267A|nr:response regulator [Arenibacter latericius]MDX1362992.1 response regulator [Arenibacter latericius]
MKNNKIHLMLADDDEDDRMFFQDALEELSLSFSLKTMNNGVELMRYLEHNLSNLPQMLFLDLNMPLKTGVECLTEIKQSEKLKKLPVVIYSTSYNPKVIDMLYGNGAHYYIRKPTDYSQLKMVIKKAISLLTSSNGLQPKKETFLIQPEN